METRTDFLPWTSGCHGVVTPNGYSTILRGQHATSHASQALSWILKHVVHAESPLRLRGVRVGASRDAGSADTHGSDARITLHDHATRCRLTPVSVGAPA